MLHQLAALGQLGHNTGRDGGLTVKHLEAV